MDNTLAYSLLDLIADRESDGYDYIDLERLKELVMDKYPEVYKFYFDKNADLGPNQQFS